MSRDAASSPSPLSAPDGRADVAATRWGDNLTGAAWMIASGLAATAMSVAIKALSDSIETPMIAFLRCLLGLWVVIPMLLSGALLRMRLTRPWLHLLRGCLMGAALNLGFYALATLNLTTATILFFLAPIFATMLAGPVLGQSVGAPRWAAVAAGFLGAVIILQPGYAPLDWGMLAAVGSAACFSVSLMLASIIGREDGARTVLVTSTAVATVICLPFAAPVWALPDTPSLWAWTALLVLSSSLRMYADIKAYATGEASFVAPFAYVRLFFVALAGWLIFSQIPESHTLLGGAVIAAATLYIAYRERKLGLRIASGPAA
ncbi:MAG: DMT family transporter [Pseudomonadota bacterium]